MTKTAVTSMLDKALALRSEGRLREALPLLQQCADAEPWNPHVLYWCGISLIDMRDYRGAIPFLEAAIEFDQTSADAYHNLGVAYDASGKWGPARFAFRQAVSLAPNNILSRCNLAGIHYRLGEPEDGYRVHSEALSIENASVEEQAGRALVRLLREDWARGWEEYEARWALPSHRHQNQRPKSGRVWDGRALKGKKIILHGEQGAGDVIQFMRYVPLVLERGGNVILKIHPELGRLAHVALPDVQISVGTGWPVAHFHASLLSLPRILGLDGDPPSPIHLRAISKGPPINKLPGLKVGLCVKGNPHHMGDKDRSMPSRYLAPLLNLSGISWVNLHGQLTPLPITQVEFEDFADTAAVIEQLDCVVTVDTSTAHLAASMGKPVLLMPPCSPEFRWTLRERSPWYPDAMLFRRDRVDGWEPVVQRVIQTLESMK